MRQLARRGERLVFGELRSSSGYPNFALIADVYSEDEQPITTMATRTLVDLGYSVNTLNRTGRNTAEYEFDIPSGYILEDEAYVDLVFNHSAVLDYKQSIVTVRINDLSLGTFQLNEAGENLSTIRVSIPRYVINPGRNNLIFTVDLQPLLDCMPANFGSNIWFTIWPETSLYLPLKALPSAQRAIYQLRDFPEPFILNPTLNQTAFVLPHNEVNSWQAAMEIAFEIGRKSKILLADFDTFFADYVPDEIRQTHHLIIIGQPTTLPIIREFE